MPTILGVWTGAFVTGYNLVENINLGRNLAKPNVCDPLCFTQLYHEWSTYGWRGTGSDQEVPQMIQKGTGGVSTTGCV